MDSVALGTSGLPASRIGLGCAALGGLFTPVTEETAVDVVCYAASRGISYFDTAPLYGLGLSERRVGLALPHLSRAAVTLSTKVGRLLRSESETATPAAAEPGIVRDYSASGVRRSLAESLERLGTDRVDLVYVHDPDDHADQVVRETLPALLELRAAGTIGAIGVGMNQVEIPRRLVESFDLDVVLLAGRWTLLDRSGRGLLDLCAQRGVAVVLGGIYNSGILADPKPGAMFDYAPADGAPLAKALAMQAACGPYGVPLAAAAVLHGLRHPAVSSILVGARSRDEVDAAVDALEVEIDQRLWDELDEIAAS